MAWTCHAHEGFDATKNTFKQWTCYYNNWQQVDFKVPTRRRWCGYKASCQILDFLEVIVTTYWYLVRNRGMGLGLYSWYQFLDPSPIPYVSHHVFGSELSGAIWMPEDGWASHPKDQVLFLSDPYLFAYLYRILNGTSWVFFIQYGF